MRRDAILPKYLFATAVAAGMGLSGAAAQDVVVVPRTAHRVAQPAPAYRGLTINRAPNGFSQDDERDLYRDGPTQYNDIRDFSPAPSVTSGVQYPYGLDGIGGFGSDLGFSEGQDTALYDRGAFGR